MSKPRANFVQVSLLRLSLVLFLAVACFTKLSAQGVPVIVNGGFETFYDPYLVMGPGSPYLPGWTIEGKGLKVAYEKANPLPYEGKQYLSFNPPSAAISQTILTSVGQTYAVTYAVALPDGGVFEAFATAGDGTLLSTNDYAVQGSETNGWALYQLYFAATTTNTTLTFQNVGDVPTGLDDITIAAVVAAPTITKAPSNVSVAAGTVVTFSASATAAGPMTIQWYYQSTAIQGATNTFLTVTANETNEGFYSVTFADAGGYTSTSCILKLNDNILINGGFEAPPITSGNIGFGNLLPGWTVLGAVIIENYSSNAYQGNQFFFFNYGGLSRVESIAQTFETAPNQSYTAAFAIGGDFGSLDAMVASTTGSILLQTNCVCPGYWFLYQILFTATTTNTTLTFAYEGRNQGAPTLSLDAVTVTTSGPPPLGISMATNGVIFSWPTPSQSFHLETSSSIDTNWVAFPATLTTNANNITATVPLSQSSSFFRLATD
ncbi:MAG TPA: DUF642 domain-containing protein [Verrucomicrobiae bacterium]|jgi:hypothetical protein